MGRSSLSIQIHRHEDGNGIFLRDIGAGVIEIECVVVAFDGGHIDVHELDRLVGRVVDGVRMPHAGGRADGSFENRRTAVDGELGLSVEDDEHLFAGVVEVVAYAAAGHDLAAMDEIQGHVHGRGGHEDFAGHVARAVMRPAARVFRWIGMSDALGERVAGQERNRGYEHQERQLVHGDVSEIISHSAD